MQRQREISRSEPTQVMYPKNEDPVGPSVSTPVAVELKNHFANMVGRRLGGEDSVLTLIKLVGNIGNQPELQNRAGCLSILTIVCGNIVKNPGDPKFRSLKKTSTSLQTVTKCAGGFQFLEALGFKDGEDGNFVLPESIKIPKEVVDLVTTLNEAAKSEISSLAAAEEALKTAAAAAAATAEADRARQANANRKANANRAVAEALRREQQAAERIEKEKTEAALAAEAELNKLKEEAQRRANEAMLRAQRAQDMLAAARAEEARKLEEAAQENAIANAEVNADANKLRGIREAAEDKRIAAERWAAATSLAGAAWWGTGKVASGALWLTGTLAECAGAGAVSMASWCSKRVTRKNAPMCVIPSDAEEGCTCEALKADGDVCGCRASRLPNGNCSCGREAHIKQLSAGKQVKQRMSANKQLVAEAAVTKRSVANNGGIASRLRKKSGGRVTRKK